MKRISMLSLVLTVLSLPLVSAAPGGVLGNIWQRIIDIGNLSFLDSGMAVIGLTRILIGILVFTIFFAVGIIALARAGFNRRQVAIVAGILAIISAIFLPAQVILAIGAGFGTLVGLTLIGLPVVGILALFLLTPSNTRALLFIKFVGALILLWILNAMRYHIGLLAGVPIP